MDTAQMGAPLQWLHQLTNPISIKKAQDLNGNLLTNSATTGTNTYEWDALNRLVAVNEAETNRSEFYYDGVGDA